MLLQNRTVIYIGKICQYSTVHNFIALQYVTTVQYCTKTSVLYITTVQYSTLYHYHMSVKYSTVLYIIPICQYSTVLYSTLYQYHMSVLYVSTVQ